MTFPRSRRELHETHPEHFFQRHFFSHGASLGPHQGLQIPDASVDVVVVDGGRVAVEVVEEGSPPRQEQQASLDTPFVQRLHSNTPPCITHASICASLAQVGPAVVVEDSEEVVVGELGDVVVGEFVLGVGVVTGHSVHLHLFSY